MGCPRNNSRHARTRRSMHWQSLRIITWLAFAGLMLWTTVSLARTVTVPDPKSPEQVVQNAFKAALDPNEQAGFDAYLGLIDPELTTTEEALRQLRQFTWVRFRTQAPRYILKGTEAHFEVSRQDPRTLSPNTKRIRLFIKQQNTKAPDRPIRLRLVDGQWLIKANSL